MLLPAVSAMLGLIGAGAAATPSIKTCAADNCLRAVQASGFPTRHGTADCSSYFLATVTPATITVVKTTTRFSSSTNTAHVTSTSTLDVTATSVSNVAATSLLDVTATTIVDVTATTTVDEGGSGPLKKEKLIHKDRGVAARQATVKPSSIPAYASPCSGAARYSSACSCLGVTSRTTTVVGPSTTKTVTSTQKTVVKTVTNTDSTAITIATDATSIITTTTGTITSTITVSTTTTTVTDSTTTTTIGPTPSDCAPGQSIPSFILQVSGTVLDGQYAVLSEDGSEDMVSFSFTEDDATIFTFNDVCNLEHNAEIACVAPDSAASDVFFNPEEIIVPYGFVPATCTIALDGTLSCVAGANSIFLECESSGPLHLASYVPQSCQALSLIAIAS